MSNTSPHERIQNGSESVGPYRLNQRLGAGGMGEVFRAWDERCQRWVAVKHVLSRVSAHGASTKRLRREAETAASLSHPSIVEIFEALETDKGLWLVMELIEGQSLDSLLRTGDLSLGHALRLALDITRGLAAAHAQGIVHRDLKTENIMVTPEGRAKILDFGLAKRLFSEAGELTASLSLSVSGALLGTGRAMSPEQAMGDTIGPASDLFSLGSLLFEMLTGHPPFKGSSFIHTLSQVCTYQPPAVCVVNPRVPEELSILIERLLEKGPRDRPQSADEVVELLERIQCGIGDEEAGTNLLEGVDLGALKRTSLHGRDLGHTRDTGIFVRTLVASQVCSRSEVDAEFPAEHAEHAERVAVELLGAFRGLEIERGKVSLWLFERPVDAVGFAQALQERLVTLSEELGTALRARIGIHLGEVFLRPSTYGEVSRGARPLEVEGTAKRLAKGLMLLASAEQILMSRGAYELAHRTLSRGSSGSLRWIAHGSYLFERLNQTIQVIEVAPVGHSTAALPLALPQIRRVDSDRGPRVHPAWLAVAAISLAVLGGLIWRSLDQGTEARSTAAIKARPTVAVLPIKGLSEQPGTTWLGAAIEKILSSGLSAQSDLRVISEGSVARMRRELNLPPSETFAGDTLKWIGTNLGTDFVLCGSYLLLGGGESLRIQVSLQETQNGRTLGSFKVDGREAETVELALQIVDWVLGQFEVAALPVEDRAALSAMLGMRPETAKIFYRGRELLLETDLVGASRKLERVVGQEPNSAMAWRALAEVFHALDRRDERLSAATRAAGLSAGLPPWDRLWTRAEEAEAAGDNGRAIALYREIEERFPQRLEVGLALARVQIAADDTAEAESTVARLRQELKPFEDNPQIDLAEAAVAGALEDSDRQIQIAMEAQRKARGRRATSLLADAWLQQAIALERKRRYDQAYDLLVAAQEALVQIDDRMRLARILKEQSILLYKLDRAEEANAKFQEIERLRQTSTEPADEDGPSASLSETRREVSSGSTEVGALAPRTIHG